MTKKTQDSLIAQKDFVLFQNDFYLEIKKGDDISDKKIPDHLFENLRTEQVLKGK